jgi:hypothetical protein
MFVLNVYGSGGWTEVSFIECTVSETWMVSILKFARVYCICGRWMEQHIKFMLLLGVHESRRWTEAALRIWIQDPGPF